MCVLMLTTSCTKLLMVTFCVRNPKVLDEKDIQREARKQDVPNDQVLVLDTNVIHEYPQDDTTRSVKLMVKNHLQPTQALYYNSSGELVSFHLTCYAKGYRSKWNHYGDFNQFPPKTAAPVDTLFSLQDQLRFIKTLDGKSIEMDNSYDYTAIFYFNRITRARGRRLLKTMKKNSELSDGKSIRFLYVNSDNFWSNGGDNRVEF